MKLPFFYYGSPILRQKAKEITEFNDETRQFVKDMVEMMDTGNGQGLAAPQVGRSVRCFVVRFYHQDENGEYKLADEPTIFINPRIISHSEEQIVSTEGCLSLPGISGKVARPRTIKVAYLDENGKSMEMELHDLHAIVFCHENDHLNGVLYIDRLDKKERQKLKQDLEHIKKKYNK